ncbi:MAG TPA: tetratricopeptide repeat protein, partial [Anaerolineae bacterium]|nr:tetratricopeptide repeat protein [Anaerolineae bacterium]
DSARADCLYRETEGNPLFIVETVRAGADCVEPDTLPATVQAVITTRLSQLSPQARELMELAAIVGREFTFEILRQANGTDEETLIRGLDELWQRRIIREIGVSAYDFSHGKLREVAYANLSSAHRRLLHRRVAEALIAIHADDVDSISAQVAAHYQQAGLARQAVTYYSWAATAAQRVYADEDVVTYLSHALDLLSTTAHAERYDLLLAREAIYDVQGNREAQQHDIIELQSLAQSLTDQSRQAEVCLREARYAEAVSDYAAAMRAAQRAIRFAEAAHDVHCEAAGYLQWGRALWQHGEVEAASGQLKQALRLSQTAHLTDVEADSLYNLACVAVFQGEQQQARDWVEQAVLLYRTIADRRGEFRALNVLGITSRQLGEADQAQSCFDQVLRLCRDIGDRRGESVVLRNLGGLKSEVGDYAEARSCFEQSMQLCRVSGDRRGESESLTYLGVTCRQMGDLQSAYNHVQRALSLAQQVGAKYEEGLALTHLGNVLLSLGQLAQADGIYRRAVSVRQEMSNLNLIVEPLAGLAAISLAQGDLAQALMLVEEILIRLTPAAFAEVDEPVFICWTCYRVLQARGDPRAIAMLKMGYDQLQAQTAQLPDDHTRQTFLDNNPVYRELMQAWNNFASSTLVV